jgi:hypothetical protein
MELFDCEISDQYGCLLEKDLLFDLINLLKESNFKLVPHTNLDNMNIAIHQIIADDPDNEQIYALFDQSMFERRCKRRRISQRQMTSSVDRFFSCQIKDLNKDTLLQLALLLKGNNFSLNSCANYKNFLKASKQIISESNDEFVTKLF